MRKLVYFNIAGISAISIILTGGIVSGCIGAESTNKRESVETRLQQLEDREEIRQLLKNYGRFLDQRDFGAFSQLFAEKEGEWIGGMGKAKGSEAIRKLMEETIGTKVDKSLPPNFHLFTNEIIHVNGNQADATTKWIFMVQGENGRPQPFYLGHYEDSMVRENGRWKFLRRVVFTDIGDNTVPKK